MFSPRSFIHYNRPTKPDYSQFSHPQNCIKSQKSKFQILFENHPDNRLLPAVCGPAILTPVFQEISLKVLWRERQNLFNLTALQ